MSIDGYCPECGHADYDRYSEEKGRTYVECGSCGYSEEVTPADVPGVN